MSADARIAVLADVHGNRWALEAVLADLDHRGADAVVNLGDSLYGPLDPRGAARLLRKLDPPSVRGNQDRLLLEATGRAPAEGVPAGDGSPTFRHVTEALTDPDLDWLAAHSPDPLEVDGALACHGTPERDDEYLLEVVGAAGVGLRSPPKLRDRLSRWESSVVLCGHSHVPRIVRAGQDRLVVNPGSVGLPAYTDEAPHPHAMEAGSPHARYAILERRPEAGRTAEGWTVEQISVVYDWERAAAAARENGRPDWAAWLRTGRAEA